MTLSQITHYALQRFEYGNVPIRKDNWQCFLFLTLHLQLIDASNLNQFLKILLSYRVYLNKHFIISIQTAIESIIEKHVILNHSFEVSWSLWIMISLNVKCRSNLLAKILDSQDSISKVVCLDIINRKMFNGTRPKTSHIFGSFVQEDLYGDGWIFVYESIFKRWLPRSYPGFLDVDPFIRLLHSSKVEFYSASNQVEIEFTYDPNSKNPVVPFKREVLTKKQMELLLAADSSSKY